MKKKIFILTALAATLFAQNSYANNNAVPKLNDDEPNALTANFVAPDWNEYDISFENGNDQYKWTWSDDGSFKCTPSEGNTSSITAHVTVDKESIFCYELQIKANSNMTVFIDGEEVRNINHERTINKRNSSDGESYYPRWIETLSPGTHEIKWVLSCIKNNWESGYVRNTSEIFNVSCLNKGDLIDVSLLEPGSIGTEVLYNTNRIQNVRRLKVAGKMNNDDWEKIAMMTNIIELDLSEAVIETIPQNQFINCLFLNRLVLPEGLTTICSKAFYKSNLEDIVLPSTLKTVENNAFEKANIKECIFPGNFINLGISAFDNCFNLKNVNLGKTIENIPNCAFRHCWDAQFILPDCIKSIGTEAFYSCHTLNVEKLPKELVSIGKSAFAHCYSLNAEFQENIQSIGNDAFRSCVGLKYIAIPKSLLSIGTGAFTECTGLETVELPVSFYTLLQSNGSQSEYFYNCKALKDVRFNSPSVMQKGDNGLGTNVDLTNVTLHVPSFLVNAYKLDPHWYNAKDIVGFDTDEIDEWVIWRQVVLSNHDRLNGNPNIVVKHHNNNLPALKINGTAKQTFNDVTVFGNYDTAGQILSNCDYVTINGSAYAQLWAMKNYWLFACLPFDTRISDITNSLEGTQYAIRYYNGENRAENGATGSWKDFEADAIIPAGTGFIVKQNYDSFCIFKAVDNDSKQNIVANKEFTKELSVNDAAEYANKGWNLVGNPYACFYNSHALNFTAPITVWNTISNSYSAYSLIDDDYAIKPFQAFFVQCPRAELNTISFPLQGRQLNATIETQNAVKERAAAHRSRQIGNIMVSTGDITDQTRIVINEEATSAYDMDCDASKFISPDALCAQIYSIDDEGIKYAINERPLDNGVIRLGFQANQAGHFKVSLKRCDIQSAILTDNVTGITTDITNADYNFDAEGGIDEERFTITLTGPTTDITSIDNARPAIFAVDGAIAIRNATGNASIYSVDGRLVASQNLNAGANIIDLPRGTYIVNIGGHSAKVLVK